MKYAVIKINGSQYKVTEGQEIFVDKLQDKAAKAEVMLLVDDDTVKLGNPYLGNAEVGLKIVADEVKGKKLIIQKFKAKSRYRRKNGFRPVYTKVLVESISDKRSK